MKKTLNLGDIKLEFLVVKLQGLKRFESIKSAYAIIEKTRIRLKFA